MTISNQPQYPMQFFDTGGGSADLLNPNKIESGTTLGTVQVGTQGPTLDPVKGIVAGDTVINAAGITIAGQSVNAGIPSRLKIKGPFVINNDTPNLYSGAGATLWTPAVGDIITRIWGYCTSSFGGSASDPNIYISVGMNALPDQGSVASNVTFYKSNTLFSLKVGYSGDPNPTVSSIAPYFYGYTAASLQPSDIAQLSLFGIMGYLTTTNPVCAKRLADDGGLNGSATFFALVLPVNS